MVEVSSPKAPAPDPPTLEFSRRDEHTFFHSLNDTSIQTLSHYALPALDGPLFCCTVRLTRDVIFEIAVSHRRSRQLSKRSAASIWTNGRMALDAKALSMVSPLRPMCR